MTPTTSYASAIEASAEMRLMRQNNLPFVVEVIGRAFVGSSMVEVEEITLLRIIDEVRKELVSQDYELPQSADKYLSDWIRPSQGEGWFQTRLDNFNERLIILKSSGRKVVSFVEMLGVSSSGLSESALSSIGSFVTQSAARLRGDSDAFVSYLEKQKKTIDDQIAAAKDRGVEVPDESEMRDMATKLSSDLAMMVNGFSQIPGEIREMAQANEEFIQSSDAPIVERFSQVLDRRSEYRASSQYRTLEALHEIHVSAEEKSRFQASIEVVVENCGEFLTKEDVRRARTLFPSLTRIATKVIEEHASLSRRFDEIFKDPDFAKRHEEARALKGARDAMIVLRDHGGLGRRDSRLNEIGLEIPVYPFPAQIVHDIRFAKPTLLAPVIFETAPIPDFEDFDSSMDMTVSQVGKGAFLEKEAIIGRIESLRDGGKDPTLRDVIAAYPPEYGTEEIAAYLWIAGSEAPSKYVPGQMFDAVIRAGDRRVVVRCPNPIFPVTGTPGEGLEDFLLLTKFGAMSDLLADLPLSGPRHINVMKSEAATADQKVQGV